MTKSIIKAGDKLLIELNKKGIGAILVNGEIKVGEYDGVDFIEKGLKEGKEEYVRSVVSSVKDLLSKCPHVVAITMSDMFYVKFLLSEEEVIAFINENGVTFNKEIMVDKEIINEIEKCVKDLSRLLKEW